MNGDSYSRDGGRHGGSRGHYSSRDHDRDERRDRDRGDRRRRSRSPHRAPRRDREYPVDSYSSSRNYRDRERETVNDRRDGRRDGDRVWERDVPSRRRDPRRDDDDRTGRRDRDPFEDRGAGGGGRGRRDRGDRGDRDFGGRDRRDATPPPKRREPTPDLTGVVSILHRERRQTQWDIKPVGYDNITAEQAKLSGMFPLPGAPRTQPMDPIRLQAFMNQPAGSASTSALKPANAKQAKRVLVHNIPQGSTNDYIADFFNLQMNGVNLVSGPDPCVSAHISKDKAYALVEFKTPEDATYALALDGIVIPTDEYANGEAMQVDRPGLSIRRPKDYISPAAPEQTETVEGQMEKFVKDGPNKLSVTNIPPDISEKDIEELLAAFGQLKAFVMAKDDDNMSRGIAFCEYNNDESTEIALEGLNGIQLGENHIKVQRASVGITQAAGLESVSAMTMLAGTQTKDADETRVLMLLNMVTAEELMDSDTYQDIMDDIREECSKFGHIIEMKIPRPKGPRIDAGVGKIFIKYDTVSSAKKALKALAGRKFSDRTVVVTFYSEELFDVNAW